MKKLSAIAILALTAALLTAGCASTATLKKLEKQNVLLQKRLKLMQKRVYRAQRGNKTVVNRPLPLPVAPGNLANVHPDLTDQMVGLPENAGFVNRTPACARQPNYWQIHNRTNTWLKLAVNGKPVVIIDDLELRQVGLVPPGMTVRLCVTLKYRGVYGPATTATVTAIKHTVPNPRPTPLPGLLKAVANFRNSTIGMETWF